MFEGMTTVEIVKLLAPVIVIQFILMVFAIYRLIKDKVRYLPKWAWVLIILFMNIVGPIIYLMIGRERE